MIKETLYKDRPAVEVSCEKFTAVFLPLDGAKIASFKTSDGYEFLAQNECEKYLRLDVCGDYEKSECSGFDDMFPTIDPCTVNGLEYPDHGEVCRREHSVKTDGEKVMFSCNLPTLNVDFNKTVYCENEMLVMEYTIQNNNEFDLPYLWAGHIMFKGEQGAYAVSNLPADTPIAILDGNPDEKRAHMMPPVGNRQYKYYYTEAKTPMKCGMVYPQSGFEVTTEFDAGVVKYLGIWVNPGELNDMYAMAVEPCTALYDTPVNAEKANAASYIKAFGKAEFTLKMSYKKEK